MSFHNALCLNILIYFSASWNTFLQMEQTVGEAEATLIFAHVARGSDELVSIPLDLNNYNKLPFDHELTFTRPVDSELIIESRWNSFVQHQPKNKHKNFARLIKATDTDIFLVYPFAVLKKTGGAIDSTLINVTIYNVAGLYVLDRTSILLNVSDDDSKVTIQVSQISTNKFENKYKFSVAIDGGEKVQNKDNVFTFEGADSVVVENPLFPQVYLPKYSLKTHESAIYHVEQVGNYKVCLKKIDNSVFVTFEHVFIV